MRALVESLSGMCLTLYSGYFCVCTPLFLLFLYWKKAPSKSSTYEVWTATSYKDGSDGGHGSPSGVIYILSTLRFISNIGRSFVGGFGGLPPGNFLYSLLNVFPNKTSYLNSSFLSIAYVVIPIGSSFYLNSSFTSFLTFFIVYCRSSSKFWALSPPNKVAKYL